MDHHLTAVLRNTLADICTAFALGEHNIGTSYVSVMGTLCHLNTYKKYMRIEKTVICTRKGLAKKTKTTLIGKVLRQILR